MDQAQFERYTVPVSATVGEAMARIESNGHRCVIVVDDSLRVMGAFSDGDARRALLAHRLMSAPVSEVMTLNVLTLRPGEEASARALAAQHHVEVFPVVGANLELLDIVVAG